MDGFESYLERMEEALDDAEADLTVEIGGHREATSVRVWHGDVLVDWARDDEAGGCLLRPGLVRRVLILHAAPRATKSELFLRAASPVVVALSPRHAQLAAQLGSAPELWVWLRFRGNDGGYSGGEERYVVKGGRVLMRLLAEVRPRQERRPA